jgi:hypothetical protein
MPILKINNKEYKIKRSRSIDWDIPTPKKFFIRNRDYNNEHEILEKKKIERIKNNNKRLIDF